MRPAHLTFGILGLLAIPLAIGVGVDVARPDYHLEDGVDEGDAPLRVMLANVGEETSVSLSIVDSLGTVVGEGWMKLPAASTTPATVLVRDGSYQVTILHQGGVWPFGHRIENGGAVASCAPGVAEARFEVRVEGRDAAVTGPVVECLAS